MDNTQLTHHGIKGMKWGVRRTQAQLGHKTSSKKKKPGLMERFEAKKKLKAKQKAAEVARKAKQTKEEYEAEKKKALESGTAADVLKFKGKLTNQELNSAVNRLNMESQLSQLNDRTTKTGLDKIESTMDKIDRIKGAAEKGISAWNTFAKIHNSLSENDFPVIDGNFKDRAEAKREKARLKAEEAEDRKLQKLIESGTPEQIAANFGKFKIKHLKDGASRFENEDKIKSRIFKKDDGGSTSDTQNSGMRTRKFKRTKTHYRTVAEIVTPKRESTTDSSSKKSEPVFYESTFVDATPSGEISAGRSYVSGLLGAGIDDQRG
jgi:hypothetical protein